MSFICHIHNYTEYNQQWNVFSAFNPSKSTHTWSSWGFGVLLKGLTSVVDTSCQSRDSNPQPRITSPTLYPLEPRLPHLASSSLRDCQKTFQSLYYKPTKLSSQLFHNFTWVLFVCALLSGPGVFAPWAVAQMTEASIKAWHWSQSTEEVYIPICLYGLNIPLCLSDADPATVHFRAGTEAHFL